MNLADSVRWIRKNWPLTWKEEGKDGLDPQADSGGSPAVGAQMVPPAAYGMAPQEAPGPAGSAELERAATARTQEPRAKAGTHEEQRQAAFVKRDKADISDKVAYGSGAGLICAGILNTIEQYTGIPFPEGLDAYIVAAISGIVGYFKKERA